jgi:hypothetical protein
VSRPSIAAISSADNSKSYTSMFSAGCVWFVPITRPSMARLRAVFGRCSGGRTQPSEARLVPPRLRLNRGPPTLRSQPDQATQPNECEVASTAHNDDEATRNDQEDDACQEQYREGEQDRRIEKWETTRRLPVYACTSDSEPGRAALRVDGRSFVSDRTVFRTFKERTWEARHEPPSRSIDPGFVSPIDPPAGSWCLSGSLINAWCGAISASLWEVWASSGTRQVRECQRPARSPSSFAVRRQEAIAMPYRAIAERA